MCDGLFLIEDTARHNGFEPDPQEIVNHIVGCAECTVDDWLDEWQDGGTDADEPVSFWPDDHTITEMNGHA